MRRSAETPLRPQGVEIVSGARITEWNFNQQRAWLEEKVYPNASTGNPGTFKTTYTYTGAGRLNSRTWARGVITQYGYNNGDLVTVSYNDGTPGINSVYDRLGRPTSIVREGMTNTLLQTILGQSRTESYSGGALAGVSVSVTSDSLLRRANVTAQRSGSWTNQAIYAYDSASGRLAQVADGENVVKYNYLANSPLVQEVSYTKTSNPTRILMSRRNSYDALNRLTATYSQAGGIQRQWNRQ